MASAAILGGLTRHTSNVSVMDYTMSGGQINLLFGLLTVLWLDFIFLEYEIQTSDTHSHEQFGVNYFTFVYIKVIFTQTHFFTLDTSFIK